MGKTFVSPLGIAKQPKKIFFGNNHIAQEISKGYIGDSSGIARQIFGSLATQYIELEYLQSDGSGWIDTGVIPVVGSTKMELQAQIPEIASDNLSRYIAGIRNDSSSNFSVYDSTSHHICLKLTDVYDYGLTDTDVHTYIVDSATGNVSYDGNQESVSNTSFYDLSIYLFAVNKNGTASNHSTSRIYYCKIWEDGTLIRNYIPCERIDDHAQGLFDTITQQFYRFTRTYFVKEGVINNNVAVIESTGTYTSNYSSVLGCTAISVKLVRMDDDFNRYKLVARNIGKSNTKVFVEYLFTNTLGSTFKLIQTGDGGDHTLISTSTTQNKTIVSYDLADLDDYPDIYLQLAGGKTTGPLNTSGTCRIHNLWLE